MPAAPSARAAVGLLRVLAIAAAAALALSGCVVIEREPEVRTPDGEAPGGPPTPAEGDDIPQAEPQPLAPASDRRLVGSLGWALLSPDVPRAVIEVDQLGGAALSREAIDAAAEALREHGGKEEVEVVVDEAPVEGDAFALDDLVSIAAERRDHESGGDTVALHVLALPGRFEVEGVPGVAFHATTVALFPAQIGGRLPPGAQDEAFEAAVLVHELGHTFGLVNRTGAAPEREDGRRPGHTDDDGSVMYWAVESPTLAEVFRDGPPSDFTDADREEMARIREDRP